MLLHWAQALLVVVVLGSAWVYCGGHHRLSSANVEWLHQTAGLLVPCVLALRFAVGRIRRCAPDADARDWAGWAEQGTYTLMYVLLCMLPLLGWALVNARGQDVTLAGITLPRVVGGHNADLAYTLQDFHSAAAWILTAVLVLHVAAALWHHFKRRDNVLRSMLPAWLMRDRD